MGRRFAINREVVDPDGSLDSRDNSAVTGSGSVAVTGRCPVWHKTCIGLAMLEKFNVYQMAKEYYWACRSLNLPKHRQEQLLRASSSVALNIAEGAGKNSVADRKHFYSIALGSLRESYAILELEKVVNPDLSKKADQLAAMLFVLSKKSIR